MFQIAETVFKSKPKMEKAEEALKEAEYYMNVLLYMQQQQQLSGEDHIPRSAGDLTWNNKVPLSMEQLFHFAKVSSVCGDVSYLRLVALSISWPL